MSTPTRRRNSRRRSNGHATELTVIAFIGFIAIMLLDPRILTWIVITVAAVVVAYGLGRVRERPPARKPVSEFRQAKRAATRQTSLRAKSDAKASRNGWLPPANPQLTTLAVSEECAKADCVACCSPGCQCTCGHDPAVIVARNEKAYDATHPDDQPPF